MKNFKKFGALLLALVMLIGVLPIETFATGLLRGTEGSTAPVEDIREREVTRNNNSLLKGNNIDVKNTDELNKESPLGESSENTEKLFNITPYKSNGEKMIDKYGVKFESNPDKNLPDALSDTANIRSEYFVEYKGNDNDGNAIFSRPSMLDGINLRGDYSNHYQDEKTQQKYERVMKNSFLKIAAYPFVMDGKKASEVNDSYENGIKNEDGFFEPVRYRAGDHVTYCMDLGKNSPSTDGLNMSISKEDLVKNNILSVIKKGYPYYTIKATKNLQNSNWVNNDLLEYATAIAIKIATNTIYEKGKESERIKISEQSFDLDSIKLNDSQENLDFQIIPTFYAKKYKSNFDKLDPLDQETLVDRVHLTYELVEEILRRAGYFEDSWTASNEKGATIPMPEKKESTLELDKSTYSVEEIQKNDEIIVGPFFANFYNAYGKNVKIKGIELKSVDGVSAIFLDENKNEFNPSEAGIKSNRNFFIKLKGAKNVLDSKNLEKLGFALNLTSAKTTSPKFYKAGDNMQNMYVSNLLAPMTLSKEFAITKETGSLKIIKTDAEDTNKLLSGVEFELFHVNEKDGTKTSVTKQKTENGEIFIEKLAPGEYELVETNPLEGYIKNENKINITIKVNETTTKQIENKKISKPGTVEITKVSKKDNKTLLDGAEFRIYNQDTTINKTGITVNGKLEFKDLEPGKYIIEETKAPEGYVRNEKFKEEIELKANETYKLTIENSKEEIPEIPSGTVVISKTDLVKGSEGIPGAKVEITRIKDENGKDVNEIIKPEIPDDKNDPNVFITDNNGKIEVKNLKEGTYKFKETVAPDGYVISVDEGTFTIEKGSKVGTKANLTNKKDIFIIKKIDSETKNPLANAKFKVYEIVNGKEVQFEEEFISDVDGKIEIEKALRMQKPTDQSSREFVIKEIEAPNGYKKMADKKFVVNKDNVGSVKNGERVVNLVLENEPLNIKVQKKDSETNEAIPGTEFEIKGKDVIEKKVTDNLGQIDLSKFAPGEYTITETKASAGYLLEKVSRKIVINQDGTVKGNLVFTNTRLTGAITKVDEHTGQGLAGAEFIFTSVDNSTIMKVVSGQNGILDLNGLPAGSYAITEIKAPEGYKLDTSKVYRANIKPDGSVEGDTIIKNAPYLAVLTKVNKEGQGISGAKFEVKDNSGKVVAEVESKAKGQIEISGLKAGEYIIVEKQAPTGYIKSNKEYKITVAMDGTVTGDTKIKNEDTFVEIKKVNKDNKALEGAEFEILSSQGKSITRGKTDKLGKLTIRRLPVGSYVIKELKAPVGYALSDKEYVFTIEEDGKVTGDTTIVNEELEIVLTKRDKDTNEYLEGAKFTLKSGNKVIQKLESDRRGEIIIKGVGPGTYTLEETEAPEGYIKADKDFKFTIGEDGKLKGRETDIYNIKASFTIIKKDLTTGAVLEGAQFVIRDKNSKVVARVTTNRNGEALVEGLGKGRYTIEETVAPTGYVKGTKAISFEVDALGKIKGKDTLEIFNKSEGKKIEIPKVPDVPKIPDIPTTPNTNIDIPELKETPKETVPTETPVKTPTEKVKTGDEDKNFAPIFLAIAALVGCGVFFLNKKKKEENK